MQLVLILLMMHMHTIINYILDQRPRLLIISFCMLRLFHSVCYFMNSVDLQQMFDIDIALALTTSWAISISP